MTILKKISGAIQQGGKSLQIRLVIMTMILCIAPAFLLTWYITSVYQSSQIQSRIEELLYQGQTLSRRMSRTAYFRDDANSPDNAALNAEINLLSDLYEGRILAINNHYMVVKDTYSTDQGKYNIDGKVLQAMQGIGSEASVYYSEGQFAEFSVPVYDPGMENIEGLLVFTTSTKAIEANVDQQRSGYLGVASALTMILCLIAFFLCHFIMKPFRDFEAELNRANEGDMTPISVTGCLETERMSSAYNQSLVRLKHLDESRQEFVSNVSHELKTPITSIRILADSLMSMGDAPVELYQEFMSDISHEIDRESRIIDDLLQLVNLDKNKVALNVEKTNINDLLAAVMKRLQGQAEQRNINISLECVRDVIAYVDELKFTRVITNLVENAIKYNNDGGTVSVQLNADQTYFYIKIVDNGVGIPEDEVDHIFERFYRVDKARSRETGGTGLGLAICREIIHLHHGSIRVSSEYGKGSTFVVRTPLIYIP